MAKAGDYKGGSSLGSNGMTKWTRSVIRNNMAKYREAIETHYIRNKHTVQMDNGNVGWSLLSPPLNSPAAVRRVRLIMRNLMDKNTRVAADGSTEWGSRTPHFLTLAVTYRCQCRCGHCSASQYQDEVTQAGSALTAAEIQDTVRQAIRLGTTCVVFTGGEPLLMPELCDLIRDIDPRKSMCVMFTNGEYLTDDAVGRLKEAGLTGLFVSLDSADAARHDANRNRPGLFEKAVAGLDRCRRAGLLTGISTTASRENVRSGDLPALMELARELKVLEVFLFDLIATGRLANRHDLMLKEEDVAEVGALRARYNASPEYPRIIHQTMLTSIAYPCAAEGCPAGVAQMHVRGNGDVCPCDFTPFAFGNVRRQPLEDIWRTFSSHPIYCRSAPRCRLSDPAYWEQLEKAALVPAPA